MHSEKIKKWRSEIDVLMARHTAAKTALKDARQDALTAEEEYDAADEAQKIIQVVAETIQEEAHDRIAGVVSHCLATVFEKPYTFKINFERARGRTEANLVFVRNGHEIDPMDGSGGGAVDIAAFALRLSCLMLSRPARRRVIIFDQPFTNVSEKYLNATRDMIEGITQRLGVQLIMVNHIKELSCGKIIEMS